MIVNVGRFDTQLPGKISVARGKPQALDIPEMKVLAPSAELLRAYKVHRICWEEYGRIYWAELAARCRRSNIIWSGAKRLVSAGEAANMRPACLMFIIQAAAARLGVPQLTLCCYERPDDEHCHRKLIYDALPADIQGLRM